LCPVEVKPAKYYLRKKKVKHINRILTFMSLNLVASRNTEEFVSAKYINATKS